MANHNSFPILKARDEIDEPSERERPLNSSQETGKAEMRASELL